MIHIYERHISWLHAALLNSNESLSNHNNGFLSVWLMLFVKPSRCVLTVLCQNKLIQSSCKLSQGHSTLSLWGIQFCPVLITLYVASRCLSVVFFGGFFLHHWLNDLPELHRGFLLKNKHKKIRVSQCRRCSQQPYSEWWSVYRFRTIQAM